MHAMIRLTVFYPKSEGSTFDHEYYRNNHVPLVGKTWNVGGEIDKGINGPHEAAVHFFFESMDQFQAAMAHEGTKEIMADVANYTNITPQMQISEVVEGSS